MVFPLHIISWCPKWGSEWGDEWCGAFTNWILDNATGLRGLSQFYPKKGYNWKFFYETGRLINERAGYSFSDIFSSVIPGAKVRLVNPNLNADGTDWVHHVAFFIGWPSDHYFFGTQSANFMAIGGNQGMRVCFGNFNVFNDAPAETDNLPYMGYTPVQGLYFKKRRDVPGDEGNNDDYFANTNPPF